MAIDGFSGLPLRCTNDSACTRMFCTLSRERRCSYDAGHCLGVRLTLIVSDKTKHWLAGLVATLALLLTGCAGFGRVGVT